MGDLRLRDAERRWRESGRLGDRVRWWSERARAGDLPAGAPALIDAVAAGRLPAERLELAAYLGHESARGLAVEEVVERLAYGHEDRALRVALEDGGVGLDDVLAWIVALRQWGREPLVRGLVAGTRHLADVLAALDLSAEADEYHAMAEYREEERARGLAQVAELCAGIDAWLASSGDGAQPLAEAAPAGYFETVTAYVVEAAALAARVAARAPSLAEEARRQWVDVARVMRPDPARLRVAVRDAIVPWALREATP